MAVDATDLQPVATPEPLCSVCGQPIAVGQWPCISRIRDHAPTLAYHPFIPYFDVALGRQIDSHADRWTAMKTAKVDYRDKLDKGTLSARRDRIEQEKKERRQR
jgi:hypothetical protein